MSFLPFMLAFIEPKTAVIVEPTFEPIASAIAFS